MKNSGIMTAGAALVLALSIAACGGNAASSASTAAAAGTEASAESAASAMAAETMASAETAESAADAASTVELTGPQDAVYTIINATGEKVVSVMITDNADSTNVVKAENLDADATVELKKTVDAAEIANQEYTLSFETESGYKGEFTTLHFETVPIQLLAADAMTGATPISFSPAK